MAPKRPPQASTATTATRSPPRRLHPRSRLLVALMLPLSAAAFLLGCAGMAVLLGPQDASLVPSFLAPGSPFASAWRTVLSKNAFVQPFLFNFGAIASVACAMRLAEDRRAAIAERGGGARRQRKAQ
jgi:hypothetical protein